jgi:hypothetical protein
VIARRRRRRAHDPDHEPDGGPVIGYVALAFALLLMMIA